MLTKTETEELVANYRQHPTDSGSTEVQVALLTQRIRQITAHLRSHRGDHHSQRGLMRLVGRRQRLLRYLSREDAMRYKTLITRLGLRK